LLVSQEIHRRMLGNGLETTQPLVRPVASLQEETFTFGGARQVLE